MGDHTTPYPTCVLNSRLVTWRNLAVRASASYHRAGLWCVLSRSATTTLLLVGVVFGDVLGKIAVTMKNDYQWLPNTPFRLRKEASSLNMGLLRLRKGKARLKKRGEYSLGERGWRDVVRLEKVVNEFITRTNWLAEFPSYNLFSSHVLLPRASTPRLNKDQT